MSTRRVLLPPLQTLISKHILPSLVHPQIVSTMQEAVDSTLRPAKHSQSPSPAKTVKPFPITLKPGVDPYAEERKY